MPLASRSSERLPFTDCDSTVEAAATAASAAAARTSASAWASASAILLSAVLVRRATKSSILDLASAAMRSASARALVTISCASRSAEAWRALYSASTFAASSLSRRASSSSALMRSARWSSALSTVRCTPSQTNTPIRITNATATQNSGSANIDLSLQRRVDRARHCGCFRSNAGEPLHDCRGGISRDTPNVAHCRFPGRGDGFLGITELCRQLLLQRVALGFRRRIELLPVFRTDGLCPRTRRRQLAFVGLQRGLRLVFQTLRLVEVALDCILTRIDYAADARQRDPRYDQIQRHERDQQRHQLGRKGLFLKRRKRGLVAAVRCGVTCRARRGAMTFSHGRLLFGRSGSTRRPARWR